MKRHGYLRDVRRFATSRKTGSLELKLEEALSGIEACMSLDELRDYLQKIAQNYGFSSFNFLDAGQPHSDKPFYLGTVKRAWEGDYKQNNFISVDPYVQRVRKTNTPFSWTSVPPPIFLGKRKPGAIKLMDAARDHGFTEGLIIPYHFRDNLGRSNSSLVAFFWEDATSKFQFLLSELKHELHLIMIYWVQRAVDLIALEHREGVSIIRGNSELRSVLLTDRERDMLAWAARGKTVSDTAEILKISDETVETHIRNAMRKLDASNKTHAVAKAIYLSLIDV